MNFRVIENIFVTEGMPDETFVEPPNFNEILVDIRHLGKPVVIEGPSGTGKTSTVKKVLERLGKGNDGVYLSARKSEDVESLQQLAMNPTKGVFIIDDFHRLSASLQAKFSDLAKIAAEEASPDKYPKLVLIGINQVGTTLIEFSPDIAKRIGIHKIEPATNAECEKLIAKGAEALNISFLNAHLIFEESQGDYWLIQTLCSTACQIKSVTETQAVKIEVVLDVAQLRTRIVNKLQNLYYESVKDFCRGRRFRPSNDPYYRILKFIATKSGGSSSVDLIQLANANPEITGSINNIKDGRLTVLLKEKARAGQYFYYSKDSSRFSVEDPAVFYFLKNLDWERLRTDCGFRDHVVKPRFDIAISFAGENRDLARYIAQRLKELDVDTYFDEDYEVSYLGRKLSDEFPKIFSTDSRFVLCILDKFHQEKIWPTFERDVFMPRVEKCEVIPLCLDDTIFVGIPKDLYGFRLKWTSSDLFWQQDVDDKIIYPLIDRIG
jgi:Ni2+-binding GTPase involved in maturation of urease and hydrogenase